MQFGKSSSAEDIDINAVTSATVAGGDEVLIGDVDDSDNIKKTTAQDIADLAGGSVSGTLVYISDATSEGESTTTSTSFVEKLSHTTPVLTTNKHRISWYCEVDVNSNKIEMQCELDNTTVIGSGYNDGSLDEYISQPGFIIITPTAATHQIDIDFKQLVSGTVRIRRARIVVEEILP